MVCPQEIIESKIDGSLTLEEDKPRVDKILFVGGNNVSVSNSYIKDGEICIEGIKASTTGTSTMIFVPLSLSSIAVLTPSHFT